MKKIIPFPLTLNPSLPGREREFEAGPPAPVLEVDRCLLSAGQPTSLTYPTENC